MKNWTVTQLIAAGAMGALLALAAMLELPLNVITGIPGSGGIVGTFFELTVFIFALLLVPRFGVGAVVGGIGMLVVLPIPVFGPAGFLPKVAIGFVLGLLFDIFFLLFKRFGKWGVVMMTPLLILISDAIIGVMFLFFQTPTMMASFSGFVPILIFNLVFIIEGVAGSLAAWHVFQKLKNTAVVRRIQGN